MNFSHVDFLAVTFAALSSFMLGALWYSPLMFKQVWMESCGLTELDLAQMDAKWVFLGSFTLCFITAFVFSVFIGRETSLGIAVGTGFSIGLFLITAPMAIGYIFEQRPLKLLLVNGGYHTLQFSLMGLVLGIWPYA